MPTPHWIGATGASWNTTASWSLTTDGAGGAAVPLAGDTVYLDKTHAGAFVINVNQNIGNIAELISSGSTGNWYLAGTNISTAGTPWNLTAPVNITVPAGSYVGINNGITGGGTINKYGDGEFGSDGISSTTFGTSPINVLTGTLFAGINNKLGTGKVTLYPNTKLYCNLSSGGVSIQNPVDVRGNVQFGGAVGTLTISGTVDLDSTTRTLTLNSGGTTTFFGDITGSAGFIMTGSGQLFIGGSTKTLNTSVAGSSVTIGSTNNLWINAQLPTGQVNQLANVSKFINNGGLLYTGNAAYTEDATIEGNGLIQANLNGATMTYSGNLSAYTGGISNHEDTSGLTNAVVFATAASFPAGVYTFSDIGGNGFTNTFIWTYTGAGAVTQTGKNYSQFRNINGTSTMTIEYANSSSNNSTVTYAGNFEGLTGASSFTGGTHNIRFNAASGDIVVSGSILAGMVTTRNVSKTGTYKTILLGNNTYTGTTTIGTGTLGVYSSNALGAAAGAVTISNGATLEISGNVSISKTTTATTINDGGVGNLGAIKSISGNNSFSNQAGFTLATSPVIIGVDAGSLALTGTIAGSSIGLTKVGNAELILSSSASTYNGIVTISSGTLTATKLSNSGIISSLGQGTSTVLTGTLKYIGTGDTTDRPITLATGTPSLDSSGTGPITFSAILPATGSKTLILNGTNVSDNKISTVLSNPSGGTLGLTKSGVGKWVISSNPTYTGTTTINNGTLQFSGSTDFTIQGNLVINGGTLDSDGIKLLTSVTASGGTLTSVITGSNSLLVNGIATIAPVNGTNYYNGTTNISTIGNAQLSCSVNPAISGQGKMFGDSTVIVSGSLSTSRNLIQLGRARYNGNVTFAAGSSLLIGNFL